MTDRADHQPAAQRLNSDDPITDQSQDEYEIAPFCEAMAEAVRSLESSQSYVLALNGSWGVGKTSAVNIVLQQLAASQVTTLAFSPWCASGRDALAWEFLNLLAGQLDKGIKGEALKLYRTLQKKGPDAVKQLGGVFGAGAALSEPLTWQGLQRHLRDKLNLLPAEKRFLVIVDDIDRLDPEEVIEVFRLIKTLGHLPRVTYLLIFDDRIAVRALRRRYPEEADSYLEKIVQVAFTLPMPSHDQLVAAASRSVDAVRSAVRSDKGRVRFENIFHELISPSLNTPRDIARLGNHIRVMWHPLKDGEVDPGDFVGLHALKAFYPTVYDTIPRHKREILTAHQRRESREEKSALFDNLLGVQSLAEGARHIVRRGLTRLFPQLDAIWGNLWHDSGAYAEWRRERRLCAVQHFDAYFKLAPTAHALPAQELAEILEKADDERWLQEKLRKGLTMPRRPTGTKTSLILDELVLHAPELSIDRARTLATAVARMADELDVEQDEARGFYEHDTNMWRTKWLINAGVFDRLTQEARNTFIPQMLQTAALGYATDVASRCISQHAPPRDHSDQKPEAERLVSASVLSGIKQHALDRLRLAAATGSIFQARSLSSLLNNWNEWGDTGEVAAWATGQLHVSETASRICEAFTSMSWSQLLNDPVAVGRPRVDVSGVSRVLDVNALQARADELLAGPLPPEQRKRFEQFHEGVRNGTGRTSAREAEQQEDTLEDFDSDS